MVFTTKSLTIVVMATKKRTRSSEMREGLRKVTKLSTVPVHCPLCDITLRPNNIGDHFTHELNKLATPPPSRKRQRSEVNEGGASLQRILLDDQKDVMERAQETLDFVRRRQFQFDHPQSCDHPGTSQHSTCPVCETRLSSVEEQALVHIAGCLGDDASSSGEESYEEYTWCNVTRVRATSMLSAQARADMFNGTVMTSVTDTNVDDVIDVEEDETNMYGPQQFGEGHIQESNQSNEVVPLSDDDQLKKSDTSVVQCLICMSGYIEPVVSVQCWHVYCESCWLQALKAQKLCPKCKRITCAKDLRRIFL